MDHVGAVHADHEGGDKGADEVGNPGQNHVRHIQPLQLALLGPVQTHVLPHQVDGGGAVEQYSAQGAHSGGHGDRKALGLSAGGIKAGGGDIEHSRGDADVRDGAHVGGDCPSGGDQGDVHNLDRRAQHNAHGDIPQNQAADQTTN